jgi:hypothetical protein
MPRKYQRKYPGPNQADVIAWFKDYLGRPRPDDDEYEEERLEVRRWWLRELVKIADRAKQPYTGRPALTLREKVRQSTLVSDACARKHELLEEARAKGKRLTDIDAQWQAAEELTATAKQATTLYYLMPSSRRTKGRLLNPKGKKSPNSNR